MTRLSQSDLEAALAFLGEAENVTGPEAFPTDLLDRFRELVPSDTVGYCELDRVGERMLFAEGCSQTHAAPTPFRDQEELEHVFWSVCRQSPIIAHHQQTGDFAACKLSDFLNGRELRRLDVYSDFFRPCGVEHRIVVGLPAPLSETKCFLFDRGRGGDFTERDRLVLDLLQPHLASLYAAARDRRRAAALTVADARSVGLVVLDPSGRVDVTNAVADRLLTRYFDRNGSGRLPEPVGDWLRNQTGRLQRDGTLPPARERLTVTRDGRRLTITRTGSTLLLDEDSPLLTRREREIVEQLAAGRSNAEIAAQLVISPATVRTHLDNIYLKLGVHSRTAAVACTRP